jgi:hypothetical protein
MEYKIKTTELFKGANYIFEKLLSKKNDKIVIDTFDSIDIDIEKAKEALKERRLYDDYLKEIGSLKFLSGKIKPLFYIQTYEDIEFYTYCISMRRLLNEFIKILKEVENVI